MAGIWISNRKRENKPWNFLNIGKENGHQDGDQSNRLVWQDREHAGGDESSLGADQLFILPRLPDDHSCDAYLSTITEEANRLTLTLFWFRPQQGARI